MSLGHHFDLIEWEESYWRLRLSMHSSRDQKKAACCQLEMNQDRCAGNKLQGVRVSTLCSCCDALSTLRLSSSHDEETQGTPLKVHAARPSSRDLVFGETLGCPTIEWLLAAGCCTTSNVVYSCSAASPTNRA
jgi:hypothetical protein